jgi:hypothetical protein
MKSILLGLAAASVVLTCPAAAQSLTGEWDAAMETPGGVRTFKLLFQVDGEKVTGTVKRQAGDVPLVGTIKGDTLTFSYTIVYEGNALMLTVTALVAGNSLAGVVDFGGAAEAEFTATRAPGASGRPAQSFPQSTTVSSPQSVKRVPRLGSTVVKFDRRRSDAPCLHCFG